MKQFIFFTIILLAGNFVYGDEKGNGQSKKTIMSDEIVITSKGYVKPLTSTIGGIGLLTSDEIIRLDPVSISDSIQNITGVYKSADSSWGSEITIRGTARDKVIMIIDGSRMNTATDIGAQFGTVNPASVERIEVLKGPVSSLYGSGSIGGVVNVFTRTGKFSENPGFESGVFISGESNTKGFNTYGFTSYNNPVYYVFGSGSYRSHNDYTDGARDKVDNSGYKDASGTLNLGFKPAAGHTLELRSQHYEGRDIGIPGARDSVPMTASSAEYTSVRRSLVSLDYRFVPESHMWLESKLHLYWQFVGRDVRIEIPVMITEPGAEHKTVGMQWTNIIAYKNNTVVAGFDAWTRRINSYRTKTNKNTGAVIEETPLPEAAYISTGVFAEDDIKFGDLTLNLGGRGDSIFVSNEKTYKTVNPPSDVVIWDEKELREYSWNGHGGISYSFFKGFTAGLLAASGYRAASLEERFKYIALGNVERWGNPELKPERSYFFESVIHLDKKRIKANGSLYINTMHNLIADIQNSPTQYQLQNIDKARIYGAEYDISFKIKSWIEAYNNLSIIRGRDINKDENLPSIAPVRSVTGLKIEGPYGLSAFCDGTYTAAKKRVPAGMEKSDSWIKLDAGISWRVISGETDHRVNITCTNLSDKTYYDYLAMSKKGYVFNEPGRSVKFGYRVMF